MKVLCFSDPHLDYPSDPADGSIELFNGTAVWLGDLIREHQPDLVVNLGDTNHRDGGMSTGTIRLAYDFFSKLFDACGDKIPLVNLVGNHDQHTRDGALHVMEMLKFKSTVVDTPLVRQFGQLRLLFMPHIRDAEQFNKELTCALAQQNPQLVFIHQDIVGAKMNSGSRTTHGFDASTYKIPIFGGHYHMPQNVCGVEVIGAPQYTQFRDTDEDCDARRGAVLLTVTNGKKGVKVKQERFTNPHTRLYGKFVGETASKMYGAFAQWVLDLQKIYPEIVDERLNVWFSGPKTELDALESGYAWGALGTVRFTPNDKINVEQTTLTLDLNAETAVRKYAESATCSCGKDHDLQIGVQAIREAEAYSTGSTQKKHVRFLDMSVQDFMQFPEAKVNFDRQGLVLIEGVNQDDPSSESNEAGKTTIIEALLWVLFDRTARGLGKDEVIRWGTKKTRVQLALEVDGVRYTFVRSRSKGKQTLNILDGEGKEITPHDQNAASAMIQKIIGASFEQFLLLVVMAQGFDTKFSGLNDADRKETLEAFLGLEIYDVARERIATSIKNIETSVAQMDVKIMRAGATANTAKNQWRVTNDQKTAALQEQHAERAGIEAQIAALEAVMPQWRESVRQHQAYHSSVTQAINELQPMSYALKREADTAEANLRAKQQRVVDLKATSTALRTTGMPCPTCKQQLPVARVQQVLNDVETELQQLEPQIPVLLNTLTEIDARIQQNAESLAGYQASLNEFQPKLNEVTREAGRLENELANLKRDHAKASQDVTRFDPILAEAQQTIASAEAEIAAEEAAKLAAGDSIHQLKYWLAAFEPTGIRSHLLRTVVNYLNEYLLELSNTMTGGSFRVQLSSTTELKSKETRNKLDVLIEPSGESYKAGSGGKRRKVDLMLNMAVARLARQTSGFSTNLYVGDEIFDNLDPTASSYCIKALEQMAAEGISVLLVSHNPLVKALVPNVWTVVRKNGASEIKA